LFTTKNDHFLETQGNATLISDHWAVVIVPFFPLENLENALEKAGFIMFPGLLFDWECFGIFRI
jgi:hypothetical protein